MHIQLDGRDREDSIKPNPFSSSIGGQFFSAPRGIVYMPSLRLYA